MSKREANRIEITRQTLLEISHPIFREGYQAGRQHYFLKPTILTDKHFVEDLQSMFEESQQEKKAEKREEELYYAIGGLVGQMSGGVIPRQPHEDNIREVQEVFLAQVLQEYGAIGPALIDTIQMLWEMQDQLARTLDADIFEQMLNRGIERTY